RAAGAGAPSRDAWPRPSPTPRRRVPSRRGTASPSSPSRPPRTRPAARLPPLPGCTNSAAATASAPPRATRSWWRPPTSARSACASHRSGRRRSPV
ncbi:MAG: hypothetical protein AVDCRST_MAG40-3358, partial [uncultured Gemmatimonadaceae bacterium]